MTQKSLDEKWDELQPGSNEPVFVRVDDAHPLDLFIGREMSGELLFILITKMEPPSVSKGKSIDVSKLKRNDGRWTLVFKLLDIELRHIFSQLCERLIESSRMCIDLDHGAQFIVSDYLRWKRLLDKGLSGVLDESTLRGLVGELIFLNELMTEFGVPTSLQSWVGPSGADQDFRFPNQWYEVKTVHPGAQAVTISSVEQLDFQAYQGELVLVYLDKTTLNEPNSFNPVELSTGILQRIGDPQDRQVFLEVLDDFGIFLLSDYKQHYYVLRQIRRFDVSSEFPLIRRKDLHSGIINIKYQISVPAIAQSEV